MPSVDSSTSSVSDVPLVVEQISTPSPQPLSSSPQPLLMLEDGASEPSVCVSEPVVSSDEMKILSELLPDAPGGFGAWFGRFGPQLGGGEE